MTAPLTRHNLQLQEVYARSGVKGGTVPGFAGSVQPTVVVADYSQTYSGEPLEARGLAGRSESAPIGQRAVVTIEPRSPGGLVIETVNASYPGSSFFGWFDVLPPSSLPAITVVPAFVLNVGGQAAAARVSAGYFDVPATPPSGAGPINFIGVGGAVGSILRFYVPSGQVGIFQAAALAVINGEPWEWAFIWREIPSAIGLP